MSTAAARNSIQTRLLVSSPSDREELEAEATGKKIARMAEPSAASSITTQAGKLGIFRRAAAIIARRWNAVVSPVPATAKPALQRKADSPGKASPEISAEIQGNLSSGTPLPSGVRRFMEPRFGASFDKVRIQTNESAARMSSQLSASAFTVGNQIFFGRGQFQPDSQEGKELIAHELTHTLQQGAVTQRKFEVSQVQTPLVQRGAIDWIKNKIKSGLNLAAERLVPGYTLLNVILGKNVITDESVSRTGVNLIRGYMRLSPVIGSILLTELEGTNSLAEAGAWVETQVTKFGINFNDLANRLETMWGEMSVWQGIDYNVEIFKKYLSPVLGPFLAFSGVVMDKVKELRFEAALRLVGATQLLAAMKKDPAAFKRLVDDPKLILKYFMDALKQGFSQFKDNFGTHFKNALFGWLFGKAAEMGIQMPKEFSAAGLFHLIAQLVGATYQQIRAQVVKKLGPRGESIVSTLEKTVDIVKDLVTRGPIALWERVKSFLSDLKEMIFSKISELVTIEIIKAAVLKLVSMLNPVGALVQLVLGIYRVVKFFIDKWETIKQLTNAILDSITNVALGNIAAAAGYIENTMAKGLTLVISFLASILGLGGIVDKVKALIKKISDPVQLAIGKVVGVIVEKGQGLLKKIGGALLQVGVPQDPNERLRLGLAAGTKTVNALRGTVVTAALINPLLAVIKVRYGLKSLQPIEINGDWWVEGEANPKKKEKTQKRVSAQGNLPQMRLPDTEPPSQEGVKQFLERVKQKIAIDQAEINAHHKEILEAKRKVIALKEKALSTPREDSSRAETLIQFRDATGRLEELKARQNHREYINAQDRKTASRLQEALDEKTYARPSFRTATVEKVWKDAWKEGNGKILSPSKTEIKDGDPWVMGHRPRWEFWKHQKSAAERGISRGKFIQEYNVPGQYRPETPEDNASHRYEDKTDAYLGPP